LRVEESERLELIGGFVDLTKIASKNREERFKFSDSVSAGVPGTAPAGAQLSGWREARARVVNHGAGPGSRSNGRSRAHFFGVAATLMRRILAISSFLLYDALA
jgi:hypothetical protein